MTYDNHGNGNSRTTPRGSATNPAAAAHDGNGHAHGTTIREYFRNIYDNVKSITIGMKITLKYCFQKTVTVQYPEQRLSFAPRYRGIHEFELDKCIACDMCAKACPVDCIYIDKSGPRKIDKKKGIVDESDPKNGKLLRYAIDYSKCLFCALCTE